jgi:hypothetical protein
VRLGAGRKRRLTDGERAVALSAVLFACSLPILRRETDRRLFWTLVVAQQVKLGAAFDCHRAMYRLYGDGSDAHAYDTAARAIAERLRSGTFDGVPEIARTVPFDTGRHWAASTNTIRLAGGAIYAVTGPSTRCGFVACSWIGFWGLYLFGRAFRIAMPEQHGRGYARLLFMPSVVFWTSVIGKEAWTVFSLGLGALGVARTLAGPRRVGIPLALTGAGLAVLARPHTPAMLGPGFSSALAGDKERTASGGSRFDPPALRHPGDLPRVAASVLFRPHPLEARNAVGFAAAAEGTALVALSIVRARWILAALASAPRRPYVAFVLVSVGILVAMLARISNFGLLARQRVALTPFYLVLVSIPPRRS